MKEILALCFGVWALPSAAAGAADWPNRPVRVIGGGRAACCNGCSR
jgi:hypothetical protein